MLTSIASAFVGLVSIASNAAINGDLCLLRPHCTVTSQVRSLFFFLFLFLSSSSATSSSSLVLSPSSAIPSSSPFFLPLRNTGSINLLYSRCLFCLFHFQEEGMIVKTGDVSLAEQLEREGYRGISMSQS
ncbi:hypothetical protein BHE74_00051783 [Ensete ventricosum]|nr:hypothetical protein BHE74_00051783 [Ensete ventricosum]RZR92877.1 hypothetical protein BHM03_00021251 [Ensete ventricosum]